MNRQASGGAKIIVAVSVRHLARRLRRGSEELGRDSNYACVRMYVCFRAAVGGIISQVTSSCWVPPLGMAAELTEGTAINVLATQQPASQLSKSECVTWMTGWSQGLSGWRVLNSGVTDSTGLTTERTSRWCLGLAACRSFCPAFLAWIAHARSVPER